MLAEEQLDLSITRCECVIRPSAMQKSNASAFPTIIFEEALWREMEYRKRLEKTHPHLLIALNGAPERQKVRFFFCYDLYMMQYNTKNYSSGIENV